MGPDLRIDWTDACRNPADFEQLVKLLLMRLHPEGEVLDGVGGDGGREFQIRTQTSLVLYEAKSFTGRVSPRSPNRRAQVEKSLQSAARHQPDIWNLVVPIDHNEEELAWFDRLRAGDYPFIERWLGKTWLEEQLCQHHDLVRYATGAKLLEYVRQYRVETDALAGGTPDLIDRYDALDKLGDEISPHWKPVIGRLPDGTRVVELQGKHANAARDAPISFQFNVSVPEEPDTEQLRAQMRSTQEFGTGVVIPGSYVSDFSLTAPAELGLPDPDFVTSVIIGEVPETENLPEQHLAIFEPEAVLPVASLLFRGVSRTVGSAGGTRLVALDAAHTVELVTEVRLSDRSLTFHLTPKQESPILPGAVLPSMRLQRALHAPNIAKFTVRSNGATGQHTAELPAGLIPQLPEKVCQFVENLAVIQDVLRQPFPLPPTVTHGDMKRADRLRRLTDGETVSWVHGSLTVTLDPDKITEFQAQFPPHGTTLRISWPDREVLIGGEVVHTGPMFMTGVVTVDKAMIPDKPEDGRAATATFKLIDENWFQAKLGTPPDQQVDPDHLQGPPGGPALGRVTYAPIAEPPL